MSANSIRPQIIIFDLDYTLWPFWVDTHVTPPFKIDLDGTITDRHGKKTTCYPEVQQVLKKLYDEGYHLAVASRTSEVKGANQLIELFGWDKYFVAKEIFPGCKTTHIDNICKKCNVALKDMLFFDDELRNISDLNKYGVISIIVENGITGEVIKKGLTHYASER